MDLGGRCLRGRHRIGVLTAAPVRLTALPASPGPPGSIAREKLVEMRAALIAGLDLEIIGGSLALLANVQASILAIEAAAKEAAAP